MYSKQHKRDFTRRTFLRTAITGTSAALLAACGAQTAVAPTVAPTAPVATAAAPSVISALRTITDARGAMVQIPSSPQRIITLSEQDLDAVLSLGLQPVGTVNGRGQQAPPAYLQDMLGNVVSVGSFNAPSLESIAALKPDLILIGGLFPAIESLPEQLSAIAHGRHLQTQR